MIAEWNRISNKTFMTLEISFYFHIHHLDSISIVELYIRIAIKWLSINCFLRKMDKWWKINFCNKVYSWLLSIISDKCLPVYVPLYTLLSPSVLTFSDINHTFCLMSNFYGNIYFPHLKVQQKFLSCVAATIQIFMHIKYLTFLLSKRYQLSTRCIHYLSIIDYFCCYF